MEIFVATIAEMFTASFKAILVVIVLKRKGALKISKILLLKSVKGREDAFTFPLLFLLVTRVKVTSSASGASTTIFTSRDSIGIGLGLLTVFIASTRVEVFA